MATTNVINGSDLMVFADGKSLAAATNHTLNVTVETVESSTKTKDDVGTGWTSKKSNNSSWEVTTDNLYTKDCAYQLFNKLASGASVALIFGDTNRGTGASSYYSPSYTTTYFSGNAHITSLSFNAQDGENATLTATFTGDGALTSYNGTEPSED